jgi:hypothetical protein
VPTVTSLFALSFHPIREIILTCQLVLPYLTDIITDDQLKYIRLVIRNKCISLHHYVQETFQFLGRQKWKEEAQIHLTDHRYVFIHNTFGTRKNREHKICVILIL